MRLDSNLNQENNNLASGFDDPFFNQNQSNPLNSEFNLDN